MTSPRLLSGSAQAANRRGGLASSPAETPRTIWALPDWIASMGALFSPLPPYFAIDCSRSPPLLDLGLSATVTCSSRTAYATQARRKTPSSIATRHISSTKLSFSAACYYARLPAPKVRSARVSRCKRAAMSSKCRASWPSSSSPCLSRLRAAMSPLPSASAVAISRRVGVTTHKPASHHAAAKASSAAAARARRLRRSAWLASAMVSPVGIPARMKALPPDGVRLVRIQSHDRAGAVDEGDIAAGRNRHLLHLSPYPDEIKGQEHHRGYRSLVIQHRFGQHHDVHSGRAADDEAADDEAAGGDRLVEVVAVGEIHSDRTWLGRTDRPAFEADDTDQPVGGIELARLCEPQTAGLRIGGGADLRVVRQTRQGFMSELGQLPEHGRLEPGDARRLMLGLMQMRLPIFVCRPRNQAEGRQYRE